MDFSHLGDSSFESFLKANGCMDIIIFLLYNIMYNRSKKVGARIARPPRLWMVCGIRKMGSTWRTAHTLLCKIPRQRPTLPGDFACLNPAQRAAGKILTKYNVARWLEHDPGG